MKRVISIIMMFLITFSFIPFGNAQALTVGEEEEGDDNLLVNGNAELGMEGWVDPDNLWYPSNEVTPYEGTAFFWPSKGACEYSFIYQDVSVSDYEAGTILELTGWLNNYDQPPNDEAILQIDLLDLSQNILVTQSRSQRNPVWTRHTIQLELPSGAVTARVKLIARRFVGSDNDAYFDDIYLTVTDGEYNRVNMIGAAEKAQAGDTIQLIANNGVSTSPAKYKWSSSYDAIATVDAKGLVTFAGTATDEVTIYAEDLETGAIGAFYFNSTKQNEYLLPGQVKNLKKSRFTTSSIEMTWTKDANAHGYLIYQYNATKKKWVLIEKIDNQATTKLTVSKLSKGTTYKFKVIAYAVYGKTTYKGKASKITAMATAKK